MRAGSQFRSCIDSIPDHVAPFGIKGDCVLTGGSVSTQRLYMSVFAIVQVDVSCLLDLTANYPPNLSPDRGDLMQT